MSKLSKGQFKFRPHDTIGNEQAEFDGHFLGDCFVDAGYLDLLKDSERLESILVGRTGTGKSALILRLKQIEENTIVLDPSDLSLQYLSNSSILSELDSLGVNLDLFYKLLWKHIFCVEMIRMKYHLKNETESRTVFQQIKDSIVPDKKKTAALNYLTQWGDTFWEDCSHRIREVTARLESEIRGEIGANFMFASAQGQSKSKMTEEQRAEVVNRIQEIVKSIQISHLNEIITLLADNVFVKAQPRYYILIDKLDENWVEDRTRYYLIRALIETIRDLKRIKPVKIVIALRKDLIDHVARVTRDAGFQEEKYVGFQLRINWNRAQLLEFLDRRINQLVQSRYTRAPVSYRDIMPAAIDGQPIEDYLISRTMDRPRDLLVFFNCCMEQAVDRPSFTAAMIRTAEGNYSKARLRSLSDEWFIDYPTLINFSSILRKRRKSFLISELTGDEIEQKCLEVAAEKEEVQGSLIEGARRVLAGTIKEKEFTYYLFHIFYYVGLVGLKTDSITTVSWAYKDGGSVVLSEITDNTIVSIHPAYYRVLGTNPR